MGLPFAISDIRVEASVVSGKPVGKLWVNRFLMQHPELRASKGTKLDPKRAKNFNETVINDYFDKLESLHARFPGGIPPEHIWNMDKKGIQLGGGRKNSSKKYLYLKNKRSKYKIRSDNLELVTVIECISAAGDAVPPSFCLQGATAPDLRTFNDDEFGRCVIRLDGLVSAISDLIKASTYVIQDGLIQRTAGIGLKRSLYHLLRPGVLIPQSQLSSQWMGMIPMRSMILSVLYMASSIEKILRSLSSAFPRKQPTNASHWMFSSS